MTRRPHAKSSMPRQFRPIPASNHPEHNRPVQEPQSRMGKEPGGAAPEEERLLTQLAPPDDVKSSTDTGEVHLAGSDAVQAEIMRCALARLPCLHA